LVDWSMPYSSLFDLFGCRCCVELVEYERGRQKDPDPDRPTEKLLFISISRNRIVNLSK
jgi:hypothetical protein